MRKHVARWQFGVRMLCALALLCVGFAHRVPVASAAPSPASLLRDLTDYVLPDGSIASLCAPSGEKAGEGKGPVSGMAGCEACRITGSVLLPLPTQTPGISAGRLIERLIPPYESPETRPVRGENALSRAPPGLLI
ncbi:hypothetical protein SAMN05880582_10915 [Rhizobium sp. RU20A]|uniref:DUF2946 domain-containing protein n=1 Tax=Rhizobium sp. RU20A TaxID=1907412 RepID=UPI0009556FFE|nr:DUF2946 domain-containing protein [Rhizobium sp. RU20A]SIR26474.1 hypothetical protein SAMN05880582_10915 [Rhizobium sp. RU20A]